MPFVKQGTCCCIPPCSYNFTIAPRLCDAAGGNATVTITDPNGVVTSSSAVDTTTGSLVASGTVTGTWSYSVAKAGYVTRTGTVTVSTCVNTSTTITLTNATATLTISMSCCDSRSFTLKDPSGTTVGTFTASGAGTGSCSSSPITLDISAFPDGFGSPWPVTNTPAYDGGLNTTTGNYVLSTNANGCRVFSGAPGTDTPKSGYIFAPGGVCVCHSMPSSLSYSDGKGSCTLTYNSDPYGIKPNTYYGSFTASGVTYAIYFDAASGTLWRYKIVAFAPGNPCWQAGASVTCSSLPTVSISGAYDEQGSQPSCRGAILEPAESFTITGS